MSFTVFLGNLPTWVTADDIKGWLSAENLVADAIKVIRNPETQESKGFAFVEAPTADEMQAIIRRFDRAPLEDKVLRAEDRAKELEYELFVALRESVVMIEQVAFVTVAAWLALHGRITIGARTSIQDGSVIHATAERATIVGDDCVVGHLVHIAPRRHAEHAAVEHHHLAVEILEGADRKSVV